MTHAETYGITGLDSTDTEYTVEQSLVRNKYKGINSARETDINGKQELFEAKEGFPLPMRKGKMHSPTSQGRLISHPVQSGSLTNRPASNWGSAANRRLNAC